MNRISSLKQTLSLAIQHSGRSPTALLMEMLKLRYSIGHIGISEYFDFSLYKNDLSLEDKKGFCGYRTQGILEDILIDERSAILSLDKITMYLLLQSHGFPIPALRAVYRSIKSSPRITAIACPEALATYLRQPQALPVYLKPAFGAYGRGNALVCSLDQEILTLGDGSKIPLDEFCNTFPTPREFGWILQEPLHAHPAIAARSGPKISGIRLHTFLTPSGPKITRAMWKINVGDKDSDNFQHGASGNMLAAIDLATGTVTKVVSGIGIKQQLNPPHPLTGRELVGFQIPHWQATRDLVLSAATAFSGFICPGWDIAICEDGPRLLEINSFGDVDLSQHAYRQGFLDQEFLGFMRDADLYPLLFGDSKPCQRQANNGRFGRRKAHWPW
ncbi:sugar-transfer associated ATP-grasp domain-containing protein [Methylomagnum sp.]